MLVCGTKVDKQVGNHGRSSLSMRVVARFPTIMARSAMPVNRDPASNVSLDPENCVGTEISPEGPLGARFITSCHGGIMYSKSVFSVFTKSP